ncbi:hypothetical protein AVEN_121585-1, partial [Araneus ventricosus]
MAATKGNSDMALNSDSLVGQVRKEKKGKTSKNKKELGSVKFGSADDFVGPKRQIASASVQAVGSGSTVLSTVPAGPGRTAVPYKFGQSNPFALPKAVTSASVVGAEGSSSPGQVERGAGYIGFGLTPALPKGILWGDTPYPGSLAAACLPINVELANTTATPMPSAVTSSSAVPAESVLVDAKDLCPDQTSHPAHETPSMDDEPEKSLVLGTPQMLQGGTISVWSGSFLVLEEKENLIAVLQELVKIFISKGRDIKAGSRESIVEKVIAPFIKIFKDRETANLSTIYDLKASQLDITERQYQSKIRSCEATIESLKGKLSILSSELNDYKKDFKESSRSLIETTNQVKSLVSRAAPSFSDIVSRPSVTGLEDDTALEVPPTSELPLSVTCGPDSIVPGDRYSKEDYSFAHTGVCPWIHKLTDEFFKVYRKPYERLEHMDEFLKVISEVFVDLTGRLEQFESIKCRLEKLEAAQAKPSYSQVAGAPLFSVGASGSGVSPSENLPVRRPPRV